MKKVGVILILAVVMLSIIGLAVWGRDNDDVKKTVNTTVVFMNGAEEYANIICDGINIYMPPEPTKLGFRFNGWYTDEALTTQFKKYSYLESKTRSDIKVYAKFIVPVPTVTFMIGDVEYDAVTGGGVTFIMPSNPRMQGFAFDGWFTDVKFTTPFDENAYIADDARSDIKVYAKFTRLEHTITFNACGGIAVDDITAKTDAAVTLPKTTRAGYTFGGWSKNKDGSDVFTNNFIMPMGGITLYAVWLPHGTGLEYTSDGEGGLWVSNGIVTGGDVVVPSTYHNIPVTAVKDFGFSNTSITSIILGDNIRTIGEYAFNDCTALASITIPESVATIGNFAFARCTSLTINAEVTEAQKPSGWEFQWNDLDFGGREKVKVNWGVKP